MKSLTLLLIPLLFFMTSCSIDWNDEKDKKITELENRIQDDTFKKKQECGKFIEKIGNWEFHEIIYAEESNTCYVAYIVKQDTGGVIYRIMDLYSFSTPYSLQLSNSGIIIASNGFSESFSGKEKKDARCAFNKAVRKLRGDNYPTDGDYFSIDCTK